jgi:ArsR family transcriptional regulator
MNQVLGALKAAAEPTRLRLLALCAEGELSVTDLTQILGQSQPRVSRHLKLLVEGGLLERYREGTFAFYGLASVGDMAAIAAQLVAMLPEDDSQRRLDRERLGAIRAARATAAQAYFDANAARWDEIRSLHAADTEVEAAVLALAGDRRIGDLLDIGTGTGRMLEIFSPRVARATGVDLSREMIALARAKLEQGGFVNCSVRQADMYALPVGNAAFDCVIIHQVLHFAEHPAAVVAEAARVLRPGGLLLMVDFARHDVEELRTSHAHRRLGFDEREVRGWFEAAHLSPAGSRAVKGDPLTVMVWAAEAGERGHKPAVPQTVPAGIVAGVDAGGAG